MNKQIIIFIAVAIIGFAVNENIVVTAQSNSTNLGKQKIVREKEVLVNELDTLRCVLGHLFNLKSGGEGIQAIEIAKANRSTR